MGFAGGAMLRLWIWPLLALAAMLIPAPARPQPAPQRIVAVGDLHGDYEAWFAIAQAAGLVDAKGRWTGGETALVQLGDVVDRGPDSLKIIRHLMKLQREAPKKDGRVVALVGNHEAMMMTGDLRYVHSGEYRAFVDRESEARRDRVYEANRKTIETAYRMRQPSMTSEAIRAEWIKQAPLGMVEHQAAWRPDGELGKWAMSNPAVAKLGDTLFVHGGISAAYAGTSIEDINRKVATALKIQNEARDAIINDPQGPLWYRGLIVRGDGDPATVAPIPSGTTVALTIDQEVDLVLRNYGVKRIVVGHTPSPQGILSASNEQLWRADSAISRAYGGKLSYLEIQGGKAVAHYVPRPASTP
jgi:hypothetical protein